MKHATKNTKQIKNRKANKLRVSYFMFHDEGERGFSLIEAIVYVGLLSIIVSVSIYFIINIFSTFNKLFAQKEVLTNTQYSLDTITEEIKFAKNIYAPTSVFNQDNGQLSIETIQTPPTGESTTFTDFYLDNGRIYEKKEGQTAIPLTSNQVKINKLNFRYLNPANAPEGVQIFIESQFNTTIPTLTDKTLMTFTTSAIIRYR